jgi:hypothetical protein
MYREPVRPRGGPNWMGVSFLLLAVFMALLGIAVLQSQIAGPAPTPRTTSPAATPSQSAEAELSPTPASPAPSGATTGSPPSPTPAESTTAPSQEPADPSECTGTDGNRAFLATAADDLPFDVYCAALPDRWALVRGSYSGRNGGLIELTYRGPGGAMLRLREGNVCDGEADCPPGEAAGEAPFGALDGELRTSGDDYVVVSEEGSTLVYLAEFSGLDEAAARAIAENLLLVE